LAQRTIARFHEPDGSGQARSMSHKRDIKQFRQACREVGLTVEERYAASEALHAEKASGEVQADMSYAELCAWLRQWVSIWPQQSP
jgi:hypothetical protein